MFVVFLNMNTTYIIFTTFTLPNSEFVDSPTRLRICGASIDSVRLALTTSGGTPSGAIVVAILSLKS